MLSQRTYQVRTAYWLWKGGFMDRKTALGLLRWIRRGQGTVKEYLKSGTKESGIVAVK